MYKLHLILFLHRIYYLLTAFLLACLLYLHRKGLKFLVDQQYLLKQYICLLSTFLADYLILSLYQMLLLVKLVLI